MTDREDSMSKKVGVCVKSQNGIVESQNEICLNICGNKIGRRCEDGCLETFNLSDIASGIFGIGFRLLKNVTSNGHTIDVVIANDGDKITSILLDKSEVVKKQLAYLEQFHLSKSEVNIIEKFLQGFSAKEISKQFFISKATLRTHLNNIYKKLPADLKEEIISSHLGKVDDSKT